MSGKLKRRNLHGRKFGRKFSTSKRYPFNNLYAKPRSNFLRLILCKVLSSIKVNIVDVDMMSVVDVKYHM